MKNLLPILLLVTFSQIAKSQDWSYSNTLSGEGDITAINSIVDNSGNILSYGYFDGEIVASSGEKLQSNGGRDYFVAKFDSQGKVVWLKSVGSHVDDWFTGGIGVDINNNVFITGGFQEYLKYSDTDSIQSSDLYDTFLAKYDGDGNAIWCLNIGQGTSLQVPTALLVDNHDSILVGGWFFDSIQFNTSNKLIQDNPYKDYYFAKFDSENGEFVWANQLKSLSSNFSGFIYTFLHQNDSYFISGVYSDSVQVESDTIIAQGINKYDIHLMRTDISGSVQWIRRIRGLDQEYSFSIVSDESRNVYLVGYYRSDSLVIDSTESITTSIDNNLGSFDFLIVKYDSDGNLLWKRSNGGKGDDRLIDADYIDGELHVTGYFADTINWGGIKLETNGVDDIDMFVGSLDSNGNYRNANSYSGKGNSEENSRSIFIVDGDTYTIIQSNSEVLVLGDSIYTSSTGKFYIALGIIGCLPISIDQVIAQDVQTCYGDSTGAIQILASGGFGAPWQYSIDNGLSYQDAAYFANIPAGDYPIVVIDAENCAQPGPTETVSQPEQPLSIELVSEEFTGDSMVNIVVAAYGGTPPYTFTLQPNGIVQGFGDFSVKWSQPGYYVVEVTDLPNCGPVATDTLTTSSGIDLFTPGVKLYPNPTSGIITVEVPFQGSACTLEVLSLTGQVMFSRQVYSNGISVNETIDLSDLSKGMYMIRVDGQTLKSGVVVN